MSIIITGYPIKSIGYPIIEKIYYFSFIPVLGKGDRIPGRDPDISPITYNKPDPEPVPGVTASGAGPPVEGSQQVRQGYNIGLI